MGKRSLNEILDAPFVTHYDACQLQRALYEARDFLQDMTAACHGKRAQRAAALLKKWDEHG